MPWLRQGSAALNAFRWREIHARFQNDFLIPLERARARNWNDPDRDWRVWSLWPSILISSQAVATRYPEEAGPRFFLSVPPLVNLADEAKARIAEEGMRLFEAETRLVSKCDTLESQIADLRSKCSEIDEISAYEDREGKLDSVVSEWRKLYDQFARLPYGVWVP